jgi:NAD(P)-dependent dehydrogenase (short-subunit alcohol dehydrogenase family)
MMQQLAADAAAAGQPAPSLELSLLDLASLASVRGFVQRWEEQARPLHVLINNAGMFNMGGEPAWCVWCAAMLMRQPHACRLLTSLRCLSLPSWPG